MSFEKVETCFLKAYAAEAEKHLEEATRTSPFGGYYLTRELYRSPIQLEAALERLLTITPRCEVIYGFIRELQAEQIGVDHALMLFLKRDPFVKITYSRKWKHQLQALILCDSDTD